VALFGELFSSAVERISLHRTRRRKEKQQQHRLAPRPDEGRTHRHREHEKMDVDFAPLQVLPRVDRCVPPARDQPDEIASPGDGGHIRPDVIGHRPRDPGDGAHARQLGQQAPFLILGRRLRFDFRPLHLPPVPHFFGGHACIAADDGRRSILLHGKTHRRAGRSTGRELRLHRRDGRREFCLQSFDLNLPHGRNGHRVRRRIDSDRRHSGLRAQELHEFIHPFASSQIPRFHDRTVLGSLRRRNFICASVRTIHWLADSFS
jgi:hypothetical protein